MVSLPEAVSSLFENSFLSPNWSGSFDRQKLITAFNVYEDGGNFYLLGLLPGLNPEKFEITAKETTLTISGKYSFNDWPQGSSQATNGTSKEAKESGPTIQTLLKEIPEGEFYRQIQLPATFDTERIEAHYEDGLLKLRLPKTQSSQTRRIQVQTGKQPQLMEGQLVGSGQNSK
jgi:HSP20 family protein